MPTHAAPAASKEATGGACWRAGSGWVSSQVGWPQPVRWPATSRLSLTAKVRPARGPSGSVGATRASQWSTKHPPLPVRGTSGRTSTTLGASPSDPRSVVVERRGIGRSRAVRGFPRILARIRRWSRRIDRSASTEGRHAAARMSIPHRGGAMSTGGRQAAGYRDIAREKFETVLLSQPGERALSQVIPFAVVTNTRIQSAFPRTFARAP